MLFAPDAGEVINIVAMAMKTGQDYTFLRDFIFTHPSMSEALNDLFSQSSKNTSFQSHTLCVDHPDFSCRVSCVFLVITGWLISGQQLKFVLQLQIICLEA